jgi:IMP dehydrogenase/GMP reductase
MSHTKTPRDGITFDHVLLIPARSDFIPSLAAIRSILRNQ